MEECKICKSTKTVKNGFVRQKQRYKCKSCGHNFVWGDERRKISTELKRITSVLLYSLGKASFRFLAKLFDVSPTTTYNWVRQTAESFGEPVVDKNIKEIEINEMWHFLQSKKTKNGSAQTGVGAYTFEPRETSGAAWSKRLASGPGRFQHVADL